MITSFLSWIWDNIDPVADSQTEKSEPIKLSSKMKLLYESMQNLDLWNYRREAKSCACAGSWNPPHTKYIDIFTKGNVAIEYCDHYSSGRSISCYILINNEILPLEKPEHEQFKKLIQAHVEELKRKENEEAAIQFDKARAKRREKGLANIRLDNTKDL